MMILLKEDNLVDPKELKLPNLETSKISGIKTNYYLLTDISSAANLSNVKVTPIKSEGTSVNLEFEPNTESLISSFSQQLIKKQYSSGGTGNRNYLWNNLGYKVTNTNQEPAPTTSGTTLTNTSGKGESGTDYAAQAKQIAVDMLTPAIQSVVTENINRIKKLMNL